MRAREPGVLSQRCLFLPVAPGEQEVSSEALELALYPTQRPEQKLRARVNCVYTSTANREASDLTRPFLPSEVWAATRFHTGLW